MARPRSPNQDRAYEIYKEHDGNITNREIAAMLGEDEKVVAVWKSRGNGMLYNNQRKVVQQKPKAGSREIRTLLAMAALDRREIRMQSLRESLKLFF